AEEDLPTKRVPSSIWARHVMSRSVLPQASLRSMWRHLRYSSRSPELGLWGLVPCRRRDCAGQPNTFCKDATKQSGTCGSNQFADIHSYVLGGGLQISRPIRI